MSIGPRAQRVHALLRECIAAGELAVDTKLPAHTALAMEYGVSPLTMRQVLARLETEVSGLLRSSALQLSSWMSKRVSLGLAAL
jgi:DNA-binding GntR family transcriptional regulator